MLTSKIAFITGAGSGIGRASCQLLAKEGATVIATDLKSSAAEATVKSLPGTNHVSMGLDVSKDEQVQSIFSNLKAQSKVPSIIINCAGITGDSFLVDATKDVFQRVVDVNLGGTFSVAQNACKALMEAKSPGSIVNVSSIVATMGNVGQCSYGASKAGVVGFTKSLALEMAKYNIRCNAVMPGFTDTPMVQAVPEKVKALILAQIPLRRMAAPEEIAELILFLASDKSSYMTGTAIPISGGLYS
nr:PREDICTED: estradiol 17-beta-dehydrogenase 8 [Bemisia tabaci]